MKNEVLAKAMTGIEDELIVSARMPVSYKNKRNFWKSVCAAAACLFLIIGIAFMLHDRREVKVSVYGNLVENQAIALDVPEPLFAGNRQTTLEEIVVPIQIETNQQLTIEALDGQVEGYVLGTQELLFTGQIGNVSTSVMVYWFVDYPKPGHVYQLRLKNATETLCLFYDENSKNWLLEKK